MSGNQSTRPCTVDFCVDDAISGSDKCEHHAKTPVLPSNEQLQVDARLAVDMREEAEAHRIENSEHYFAVGRLLRAGADAIERLQVGAVETGDESTKVANLLRALDAKQAKIDALMMEYCPGEMSKEQRDEWAKHQQPVSADVERSIAESFRRSPRRVDETSGDRSTATAGAADSAGHAVGSTQHAMGSPSPAAVSGSPTEASVPLPTRSVEAAFNKYHENFLWIHEDEPSPLGAFTAGAQWQKRTDHETSVTASPIAQAVLDRVVAANLAMFLTSAVDHIEKGGNEASGDVELTDGTMVHLRMSRIDLGCDDAREPASSSLKELATRIVELITRDLVNHDDLAGQVWDEIPRRNRVAAEAWWRNQIMTLLASNAPKTSRDAELEQLQRALLDIRKALGLSIHSHDDLVEVITRLRGETAAPTRGGCWFGSDVYGWCELDDGHDGPHEIKRKVAQKASGEAQS